MSKKNTIDRLMNGDSIHLYSVYMVRATRNDTDKSVTLILDRLRQKPLPLAPDISRVTAYMSDNGTVTLDWHLYTLSANGLPDKIKRLAHTLANALYGAKPQADETITVESCNIHMANGKLVAEFVTIDGKIIVANSCNID